MFEIQANDGLSYRIPLSDIQGAGGFGHIIEDEATPLTPRAALNFVGANVVVTDDAGNDATVVTIAGAASVLTTKGDILGFDTGAARIPVGTNGQALLANSVQPLGVEWTTLIAASISDFEAAVTANASVTANTAKVTNATHTGDVTGSVGLTIAVGSVDIAMLSATGTPDGTTFLRGDNTWAVAGGGEFTGPMTAPHNYAGNNIVGIANLVHDQSVITYASTLAFDFDEDEQQTLTLTGVLSVLTTSNRAVGKSKTVFITADSIDRLLTFNTSWITNPTTATVTVTANTFGVLTFTCTGTAETDVWVAYAEFDN
jgi:hypothetical protein